MTTFITKFALRTIEISTFRAGELKFITTSITKLGLFTILKLASGASHSFVFHYDVEQFEIPNDKRVLRSSVKPI